MLGYRTRSAALAAEVVHSVKGDGDEREPKRAKGDSDLPSEAPALSNLYAPLD
jgi:hypothetical protein